ncbi:MAG: D-xylose transport system permease protein [Gaiellaceae bacterium]|nr:D-xylose transport system permease protein [Gaiellaceae bacterium]
MATTTEPPASGFSLDEQRTSVFVSLRSALTRSGGDMGARPAIAGLITLFILFSLGADKFASKANFANLITQATWVMILAVGVTFVLLLGEIDLSAGYTAGVCVVTIAWLIAQHNVSAWVAIPVGFLIGAAIGTLTGWLVAKVGIPAFVATLAFFLAWQGVVLLIAKEGGTIPINNELIIAIVNKNLSPLLGWVLWAIVVAGYLGMALTTARSRARSGLASEPIGSVAIKAAIIAVGWGIATYLLNDNRSFSTVRKLEGVPIAVPVVLGTVFVLHMMLSRTTWGRHVYAVGGNAEAARRAGINVVWVKMSCFIMTGVVACLAGMALGSQLNSVSPQTGGNDTLLRAVGAAAIGGVSLFGGRGKLLYPVVGGLVVATIDNGLGLMGKVGPVDFRESGPKFIIQGLVLLLAASVDALSRKRAGATT